MRKIIEIHAEKDPEEKEVSVPQNKGTQYLHALSEGSELPRVHARQSYTRAVS